MRTRSRRHNLRHGLAVVALPVILVTIASAADAAGAQVVRLPRRSQEPALWASAGVGYAQMSAVSDGRTNADWGFGDGLQYRASLEYALGGGMGVGLVGSFARLPMTYAQGTVPDGVGPLPAPGTYDAHGDVRSLHAGFHSGGRLGFHQVIQVGVGVTSFANFRRDDTDAQIGPSSDTDFSFSLGYGFGYSLGARMSIYVVQDLSSNIHQKDGLPNDARRMTTQYTTRAGLRMGVGQRRTRM